MAQGSSRVQQVGTARASSRAALTRDVSRAFLDRGATPFSINRLRRRLASRTTAIRPSGSSTSPSCQAIPSGAASGSLIQASFGSSLTLPVHHVPSPVDTTAGTPHPRGLAHVLALHIAHRGAKTTSDETPSRPRRRSRDRDAWRLNLVRSAQADGRERRSPNDERLSPLTHAKLLYQGSSTIPSITYGSADVPVITTVCGPAETTPDVQREWERGVVRSVSEDSATAPPPSIAIVASAVEEGIAVGPPIMQILDQPNDVVKVAVCPFPIDDVVFKNAPEGVACVDVE